MINPTRDYLLLDLIDSLHLAHRIFGDVIDRATEGVSQYDIEAVFGSIDAAAEFLENLRLSLHEVSP